MKYVALAFFLVILCGVADAADVDDSLKDKIKSRAAVSAIAEWCELDWNRRSFSPFMKKMRHAGYDEKAMAYIATYHGVYMQRKVEEIESLERSCGEDDLRKIKKYIID